jgi:hypothetical protein
MFLFRPQQSHSLPPLAGISVQPMQDSELIAS